MEHHKNNILVLKLMSAVAYAYGHAGVAMVKYNL